MKYINITLKKKLLKMISIFCFFILSTNTFCQKDMVIDSLLNVIKTQSQDTLKVNALNELAWLYRKNNPIEAEKFARNAKKISDSLFYLNGRLTSLIRLGTVAFYQKDYQKAERLYLEVLKKETERKNDYGIGRATNQLGLIYKEVGALKKALNNFIQANEKFEFLNKKKNVAIISNNIGDLFRQQGNYKMSMEYFLRSLEIHKVLGNKSSLASTYLNIGILHLSLNQYTKAIDYFFKSEKFFKELKDNYELSRVYNNIGVAYFKMKNYTKALKFYTISIDLKNQLGVKEKDPSVFNNLGNIYHKKRKYDLALLNYKKSLQIEENKKAQKFNNSYSNIGHIYYTKGFYPKAIEYYKKALSLSNTSNRKFEVMNALNNLSNCYSELKQYDIAMNYSDQYLQVRDSLEKNYKKTVVLKANYQEKQKQIELLQKDKKITTIELKKNSIENKRKNTLIYALLVGFVLVSLLFFAIIRGNKQKKIAEIAKKNQELEEKKIEELLKKQELKSINAMIDGQEKERKRIATDLHDGLGSMLAMVKNHFKSVEDNLNIIKDFNVKQYKKANKLLDEACEEVRKISHDMASGTLTNFGLIAALEDLSNTLEESNQISVEFVTHGLKDRLNLDLEITIYRIIQELISNILKYAKANEVTIQLVKSKNGLNIIVEDNGIGFQTDKLHSGIGLKNIASRVDAFDGDLQIDSALNKGTTITIDIPLKNNQI